MSGAAQAAAPGFFAKHGLPIGLQLYTIGPEAAKDLDGALKAVAAIGYRAVESAGLAGRTPAAFRAALDRAGLVCPSAHIPPQGGGGTFGGDLSKLADDLHVIGVKTAVAPMIAIPPRFGFPKAGEGIEGYFKRVAEGLTAEDWKAMADLLNARAAGLKAAGIKVGYHNHNFEFVPVAGDKGTSTNGLEILLAHTDPGLVTFELDIGWAAAAGIDPVALFGRHRGRFSLAHVKDLKPGGAANFALQMEPAEVGAGALDWKKILPAAHAAGVRGFYVEQEPPFSRPRLEAAKIDHDYLAGVVG